MKCLNCDKEFPNPTTEGRIELYRLTRELTLILQKEGYLPQHRILGVGEILDRTMNCCDKPKIVGF